MYSMLTKHWIFINHFDLLLVHIYWISLIRYFGLYFTFFIFIFFNINSQLHKILRTKRTEFEIRDNTLHSKLHLNFLNLFLIPLFFLKYYNKNNKLFIFRARNCYWNSKQLKWFLFIKTVYPFLKTISPLTISFLIYTHT